MFPWSLCFRAVNRRSIRRRESGIPREAASSVRNPRVTATGRSRAVAMTFSVCLWKTDHSVIFLIDSALVFFTRSIALCLSFLSVVTVFSMISTALS